MTRIIVEERLVSTSNIFPTLCGAIEFISPYSHKPEWAVSVNTVVHGPKAGQFLAVASHRSFWEL